MSFVLNNVLFSKILVRFSVVFLIKTVDFYTNVWYTDIANLIGRQIYV